MREILALCAALAFAAGAEDGGLPAFRLDSGDLMNAIRSFKPSVLRTGKPVPGVDARPGVRPRELPAAPEAELARCPGAAEALRSAPDPDLYTYVGYRWVRSDDSTCAGQPSDRMFYPLERTTTLSFSAGDAPPTSAETRTVALSAPEYRLRKNFYFRTQLDGTRRFYAADLQELTGRQVPETVVAEFPNRARFPLLPWDATETFRLDYGRSSGARLAPVQTPHDYDAEAGISHGEGGRLTTTIRLSARARRQASPTDPQGVQLSLEAAGRTLKVRVLDRWAAWYRGEKLGLRVKLWRNVRIVGDKVAYELDVLVDPAASTTIDIADPRWDAFRREAIKPGHEYYADWSFSRNQSRVSSPDWIVRERTGRVKL